MILTSPLSLGLSVWSLVPAVAAVLAYAWAARPGASPAVLRAWPLAWCLHALAGLAQMIGLGLPQSGLHFGFAPALSVTAWLVLGVYAVESRLVPLPAVRRSLAWLGGVTLVLASVFPGDGLHRGSPWAPLHWLLGMASYGLVAAAVLHAVWLDRTERALRLRKNTPGALNAPPSGLPLLTLEKLTYRFVTAGFAVLTLAVLLGIVFSPSWRWDHKTVFSLLGWAVLAALLAGRHVLGWRGRKATRWLYVAGVLLLLAYVGSRFVLEVLLHRVPGAVMGGA